MTSCSPPRMFPPPSPPRGQRHAQLRSTAGATAALTLLAAAGCATTSTERLGLGPLRTVPQVDLQRYLGTWYDIASFPQRFQRGCTGTTATYSLVGPDAPGEIAVLNRCRQDRLDGEERQATGRARVVDTTSNAKLEVSFFGPFWAAYWIIDLDADYQWAVVGHPSRDYLWILSRQPALAPELYAAILDRLRGQGYEVERLERVLQWPTGPA